jgi:lysozyme
MRGMKQLGPAGEQTIKDFEQLRLVAYRDQAGIWTNGWGHVRGVTPFQKITAAQAQTWFREDVAEAVRVVNELDVQRPEGLELTQLQFDALVSFEFNTGGLSGEPTTIRRFVLEARDDQVDDQMLRWCKVTDPITKKKVESRGLKRRRLAEAALWNEGCATHPAILDDDPVRHVEATAVPAAPPTAPVQAAKDPGVQGVTIVALSAAVGSAADQLKPLAEISSVLKVAFVVLTVVGVGLALYGARRAKRVAA